MTRSLRRRLVLTLVLTGVPTGLLAQDDVPEPDSVMQVEPVLVRVLQSSIDMQSPHPVSVVVGDELTRGNAGAFLEEALRAVPGVQIQNRFNLAVGERLSIRGFGPRAQFGVRGVRILVDGIPATLPDGQATLDHLDLAGLGRVEALRGPSAALYGNAAGGVLHFRTLDPSSAPSTLSLRGTTGSHGLLTLQGVASGRSGRVGYRVGFSQLGYDGFRRDPIADDGSTYGEASRSVANATVVLPLGSGDLRVVANAVDLDAENAGSLNETVLAEGRRAAHGFNVLSRTGKEVQQGQLGASWQGGWAGAETELSVWGIRRELENPIPGTVVGVHRSAGGMRALYTRRKDGPGASLGLGAGFELELQRDDRRNWDNDGGDKGPLTLSQIENVRGTGLFTRARLDIGERVSVLGGLRYDRFRFSVDDRFVGDPALGGDPDDSGSRTMDAVSPSVGVVVSPVPEVELFGSAARSFETPTTTELANRPTGAGGFNPTLEPQKGTTLEGGLRGRVASSLGFEATLFRTTLDDGLISYFVPTDSGRVYFRNAGEIRHTGWELAVDGRPAPGATARVAYTRVNARFERFVTEDGDVSGNRVPGLAPHRVDALVLLERGSGFLEIRGLYQDEVPVDDAGQSASEAYFLADVRVGFNEVPVGAVRFSPFVAVANLLDETYTSSVVINAFGTPPRFYEPGPGRTYRFGVGVTWAR